MKTFALDCLNLANTMPHISNQRLPIGHLQVGRLAQVIERMSLEEFAYYLVAASLPEDQQSSEQKRFLTTLASLTQ